MLDAWVSAPHYLDHLAPVWRALPAGARGALWTRPELVGHAAGLGLDAAVQHPAAGRTARPVLFMSRGEIDSIPGRDSRPLVFMEHGAGQPYAGRAHLPHVPMLRLVLTTRISAGPMATANPQARIVEVGCPKLDGHVGRRRPARRGRPTVAVSFHWDQPTYPETRSSWPWCAPGIEALAQAGAVRLLGHWHPADGRRKVRDWWESLGVEVVADFAQVLARADCYVADNTSTLYEAAAAGIPVVAMSPPWYRRDVDHGLRFWTHVPGGHVLDPHELPAAVAEALADVPERAAWRARAVEACYGPQDGAATGRAVDAIVTWLAGMGDTTSTVPRGTDPGVHPMADDRIPAPRRIYRDGVLIYAQGDPIPPDVAAELGLTDAPAADDAPAKAPARKKRAASKTAAKAADK